MDKEIETDAGLDVTAEDAAGQSMLREFFLGFIKIHILHHATRESVYGLQLIEELGRHGYHLSPGKLYPVLHELERSGYLVREERLVAGRVRKYYWATPRGAQVLSAARARIAELVTEVLQGQSPQLHSPVED